MAVWTTLGSVETHPLGTDGWGCKAYQVKVVLR